MARIRKLTLPCISALTAQLKSLKDEPWDAAPLKDQGTANRDVGFERGWRHFELNVARPIGGHCPRSAAAREPHRRPPCPADEC